MKPLGEIIAAILSLAVSFLLVVFCFCYRAGSCLNLHVVVVLGKAHAGETVCTRLYFPPLQVGTNTYVLVNSPIMLCSYS
jgi:hypothetical protein